MITVETLKPTALTDFVKVARRLHQLSDWSDVPFSAAALRKSMSTIIRRPDFCALIALDDGEIKGFLIGSVDTVIYGRTRIATDIEFAAEKGGNELFEAFKAWAKGVGAKYAINGVSDSGREKAKDRFFRKHGANRVGGVYKMRIEQ